MYAGYRWVKLVIGLGGMGLVVSVVCIFAHSLPVSFIPSKRKVQPWDSHRSCCRFGKLVAKLLAPLTCVQWIVRRKKKKNKVTPHEHCAYEDCIHDRCSRATVQLYQDHRIASHFFHNHMCYKRRQKKKKYSTESNPKRTLTAHNTHDAHDALSNSLSLFLFCWVVVSQSRNVCFKCY